MKLKKINTATDFNGFYLHSYYSKYHFGDDQIGRINIGEYHVKIREFIYSLKNGFYNNNLKLFSEIDRFVGYVIETFGYNIFENKTILTIPASSNYNTVLRWQSFTKRLCNVTGANNGFDNIVNQSNHVLPEQKFEIVGDLKDKQLIVIDDVITSGYTSKVIFDKLVQKNPKSILFLFFAKTKYDYPFDNLTEEEISVRSSVYLDKLNNAIKLSEDISSFDTSCIIDMSNLFRGKIVKSDISLWNVSNVYYMNSMFENCSLKSSLSKWNVGQVVNMSNMFKNTDFRGNISEWNISRVENMNNMFYNSSFNGDISKWDLSNCKLKLDMDRFKTKGASVRVTKK